MSGQTEVLSIMAKLRPFRCDMGKIRVGALADGGYVLPDDCDGLTGLLSLGVGGDVSFDEQFARRGVPIYQYDPTVEGPPTAHENFHFHKTAWGPADEPGVLSLASIMQAHGLYGSNDALLKFDIEGGEWEALTTVTPDHLKAFRIIACELHALHALYDRDSMDRVRQAINLLTQHHTVVHLHANNCCGITLVEGVPVPAVIELTLLRNDRSSFTPSDEPIPGPLDFPNMDDRPDLVLRPFG